MSLLHGFTAVAVWSRLMLADTADRDVFDRPVLDVVAGRPTFVLFANRATKEATSRSGTDLAVRLHDVDYATVVRVDLRGIPGLFESIARMLMRDSHEKGLEEIRRRLRQDALVPHREFGRHLAIVADPDGVTHRAAGLPKGFSEAEAVVIDRDGREIARGAFPREAGRIEAAIREAARR
jgi:hypothetical protein